MPVCTAIMAGVLFATGSGTPADPAPVVNAQGPVSAPASASGPASRGVLWQLVWMDDPMPTSSDAVALHAPTPQDVVIVWPPADGSVPGSQTLILPDFVGHQHASSWSSDESDSGRSSASVDADGSVFGEAGTDDSGVGYGP
jgi:hypothetical protein